MGTQTVETITRICSGCRREFTFPSWVPSWQITGRLNQHVLSCVWVSASTGSN